MVSLNRELYGDNDMFNPGIILEKSWRYQNIASCVLCLEIGSLTFAVCVTGMRKPLSDSFEDT
jgi:hypothetical protein